MNPRAVKAEILLGLRGWLRSSQSLSLSLITPIVLLLALGFIFNGQGEETVRLGVADLDGSANATRLVALLGETGTLDVRPWTGPVEDDLAPAMREEKLSGLLVIPQGFGSGGQVRVAVDAADGYRAGVVRSAVEAALARLPSEEGASPSALVLETLQVGSQVRYDEFLLPGLVGLNMLLVGLISSFGSVLQLRHTGLLERLAVSPMSKLEWLLGRMLGQTIVSLAVTLILVAFALVFFRAAPVFSAWTLIIVIVGTLVFSGIGIVLAGIVKDREAGGTVMRLVYLPMVVVSGTFFEVDRLPSFLRMLPKLSPLTYVNDGLRADMVYADRLAAAWAAGGLAVMAAILLLVGGRLIDWTEHD